MHEIQQWGAEKVVLEVKRLKAGPGQSRPINEKNSVADDAEALEKAIAILRTVRNISTSALIEVLWKSVKTEWPEAPLEEFREKEGLRRWLTQVEKIIGPSELLHHATLVRNTLIHRAPDGWSIRDDDAK
ncbi:hypothetical protein [Methylosinus sp. C49]|uniref:hypothetical protein n=1 Tax=Methylosinus sp. C49 TaxID=2699395 RepID=UPI00137AF23E|nr:hypothetical protein [Methylosinus sp. C49]